MRLCTKEDFERVNALSIWELKIRKSEDMMLCPDTLDSQVLNVTMNINEMRQEGP